MVASPVPRPGLWRRTPPAIFTPVLGLFALGIAWRRELEDWATTNGAADVFLGAVTLLFLFCVVAYAAKMIRRPGVVTEDLRALPGRSGLSAAILCLYLLSMTLAPFQTVAAEALLFAGFGLHAVLIGVLVRAMLLWPDEQRRISPVWHLCFVGPIVGGVAATRLGHADLATTVLALTLPIAIVIWVVSLDQFRRERVPAPLRPLLAIHLAPMAVLGIVAHAVGLPLLAEGLAWLALGYLALLVLAGRWLTVAGFSAMWGALTFPLAATAMLWLTLGQFWHYLGLVTLVAATLVIVPIAFRIMKLWASGRLAGVTNAAAA